ncbi:uncharacterized protein N7496_004616 [Penicillium cataractarum]|uniref:Major facilitator superfamily (MFS) profile domain-containing protein n=1 Tax=Penicillium cataractarum TaxID=2100454 RepID=A0A9W9SFK4_9EURO|nr:uncharacterized protein N7496_004616 [Penicillium cataractarum]KAJ5377207.1 hypothetical protein N7496_004616 [Penicillium cataractarum]
MGLGVLENSSGLRRVPGTVTLAEIDHQNTGNAGRLKRGTRRDKNIILTPQPSNDPNDPLNWPYYKKVTIVAIMVFGACLNAATIGPLLSASIVVLSEEFKRPLTDITLLTGYNMVVAGASCPLASALATKYGKRPVFLASSLACVIGSIIGSASKTYHTLLAGRIIQGFAIAAYESLTFTMIGDLFYVHQRGLWVNVISFTLTAVSNMSSIISGPVTNNLGWHYLFYLLVACSGFQTLLLLLFAPETCYIRDPCFNEHLATGNEKFDVKGTTVVEHVESASQLTTRPPPAKTFWQEMAIYTGTYSEESFIKLLLGPFLCLTNLFALWTVVITGVITSTYVAISYIVAQIFSPPPYSLSTAQVGYLSTGPFLGGVIGCTLVAQTSDRLTIWMAKRNNGIYEPEFRLPLIIFAFICTGGLFGFGVVAQAQGNVYLIDFMWGMTLVGIAFAVGPCSAYAIDAFRDMSNEIFVANVMFKNFLFFGYSYFINDWITKDGVASPFYVFGGISAGLIVTALPVYLFGKKYRSMWSQYNIMEMLKIQTHAEM